MSSNSSQHRRERSRRSRRRLVALVIVLDLLGGAALAYALTRPGAHAPQTSTLAATTLTAHPQNPLTQTVAADSPAQARPHHRPHRPPAATATGSLGTAGAQASFEAFAAGQPGQLGVALAPLGDGSTVTFGSLQAGHAWSTMKVPVLATLIGQLERGGGTLSAAQRDDAALALEQSDNSAAEGLFAALEGSDGGLVGASAAVQDTLRRAGDESTVVNTAPNSGGFTTWGQTVWPASGEVAFYRSLARGCLLSPAGTDYVLSLMQSVEADQRWGAGSAGLPAPLALKGGWGPESGGGYLVRPSAIVGSGNHGYAFSALALPRDGSFATGTQMLTQLASWVARTFTLDTEPHPNDPAAQQRLPGRGQEPHVSSCLPEPRLTKVYRLDATLAPPLELGKIARGHRRIVALTGGTFSGPEMSGRLLPGTSADWQTILPDGTALGDIRYTLQTTRGDLLYVESRSIRHGSPEVLARLGRGEDVDPGEYTFRTSTRIETAAPDLDWLNQGIFISVAGRQAAGVIYEIYLVG